jgi:hypothetical protein
MLYLYPEDERGKGNFGDSAPFLNMLRDGPTPLCDLISLTFGDFIQTTSPRSCRHAVGALPFPALCSRLLSIST